MEHPLLSRIEPSISLPTLPHILLQLIETCNRQEKGIKDLSKIINQDPSISERVLRLVNSAYYSLKQKITSVDQALLLLGMDAVKNIAISSSIYQVFHRPRKGSAFDLKQFWWHSLSAAAISRRLALRTQYPTPDEAFLSGLLHDIGRIVLWANLEEEYEKILRSSGWRSGVMLKAERKLGLNHAEVGAWLIRRWDLSSFMPDALLYHHDPPERIVHSSSLVQIVYLANRLCPIVAEEREEGFQVGMRVLGLERRELEAVVEESGEEVREIARSLDIEVSNADEQPRGLRPGEGEKYEELAAWVRDISLLQSSSEAFLAAEDRAGILQIIREGLHLLFDIEHVFFFHYQGDALEGVTTGGGYREEVIRQLAIPFREESSLLVRALIRQRILYTFDVDGALSILDEQLLRLLAAEGMLCLPMFKGEQRLGVLILGIRRNQRDLFLKKRRLLTMFLNLSSLALFGFRLREKQAEHIREQRLSATSILARKVVHEAQNPLGIINNYLAILAHKLVDREAAQDDLRIVREEIRRVSQIIEELSSFSTPPQIVREPVDVNSIIRDLAKISRDSLLEKSGIRLELKLEPELPLIRSDTNKLKQVFINLLKNASEAMPKGGTVHLQSRYRHGEPPSVEVQVRDEGSGIPEKIRSSLFEPFTSSKGREGLGLTIVYTIVRELGGTLSYDTGDGGTTFKVRLPAG
jgi:HD-like signal output (HDOD) protein/signal transduction histidine kinase